jgi:heme-degrading monooxygenase HmoA
MNRQMTAKRYLPLSLLAAMFATTLAQPSTALAGDDRLDCSPVQQLRIYEVPTQNIDVFHARFRDHAARIMKKYGFDILAMWESTHDGATEFVYLLNWPDVATMKARWAKFMADEEWAAIKRETGAKYGNFVNDIEDRTLCKTDYSPKGVG